MKAAAESVTVTVSVTHEVLGCGGVMIEEVMEIARDPREFREEDD